MKLHSLLIASTFAVVPIASLAAAQEPDPVVGSVRPHYERVKEYLLRSADQMSDDDFAFRPTADVRSAISMFGHIADSQYYFCSVGLGESPRETEIEQTEQTRTGMVAALRQSFEYCDRAYAQSDAQVLQLVGPEGRERPRLSQLVLNTAHNWEHYGNIVTYLRLRGQVPPSSQPRQRS
jgi:uncharacterized damage-inducible protein DinB